MMAVLLPQEPKAQKPRVMLGGLSRNSGHLAVVLVMVVVFIVFDFFDIGENSESFVAVREMGVLGFGNAKAILKLIGDLLLQRICLYLFNN
jgi:hypothetical protein